MGAYSDRIIADGASNYWRLGETSGTTAVDVIGAKNGTISGGVTLAQAGAIADGDKAMLFNGTTGQIVTPAIVLSVLFSVEAWIRCSANAATKTIFTNYSAGLAGPIQFAVLEVGTLFVYLETQLDANVVGIGRVDDNLWHHVVALFDGTSVRLYLDGQLNATEPTTHTSTAPATVGSIGMTAGAQQWNGSLDDVAIYPRALTAAEVQAHYTLGTTPAVPVLGVHDLNTKLSIYLCGVYGLTPPQDLTTLITRNLDGRTGDYTARWKQMEQDAAGA